MASQASNLKDTTTSGNHTIKAIFFDFMGTCLDWHTTIVSALPSTIPYATRSALAIAWRHAYFSANAARLSAGHSPEDIDITHRRVLSEVILPSAEYSPFRTHFTPEAIDHAIAAWHRQKSWSDVAPAIRELRDNGYEVFVHGNGTVRLQLDLVESGGLAGIFNLLISSELLGCYKPAPETYRKAMAFVKRRPEECVMVAAHEYDLRGARAVGMKTIYVYRWTDDVDEDQEKIKGDNDEYLTDMTGLRGAVERLGR